MGVAEEHPPPPPCPRWGRFHEQMVEARNEAGRQHFSGDFSLYDLIQCWVSVTPVDDLH